MSGHIHAKLMAIYAQDAAETDEPWRRWEFCYRDEWTALTTHPIWRADVMYRRKPKTININGFEVPEPCRERLEIGREYWVAAVYSKHGYKINWTNSSLDDSVLKKGLVHLTEYAAELHRKALLSFTEEVKSCEE